MRILALEPYFFGKSTVSMNITGLVSSDFSHDKGRKSAPLFNFFKLQLNELVDFISFVSFQILRKIPTHIELDS